MTNKERLEMIKHDFEKRSQYGGFIDDDDTLWLIEQAEKVEELEKRFKEQIQDNHCIICGDDAIEIRSGSYYCDDCCK